jgi:hypothetical protein
MGRKRAIRWRWRIAGALVLAALVVGAVGWWQFAHWRPDSKAFPVRGVEIGAPDGGFGGSRFGAEEESFVGHRSVMRSWVTRGKRRF